MVALGSLSLTHTEPEREGGRKPTQVGRPTHRPRRNPRPAGCPPFDRKPVHLRVPRVSDEKRCSLKPRFQPVRSGDPPFTALNDATSRHLPIPQVEDLLQCLAMLDDPEELIGYARTFLKSSFYFTAIRSLHHHRARLVDVLFEVRACLREATHPVCFGPLGSRQPGEGRLGGQAG